MMFNVGAPAVEEAGVQHDEAPDGRGQPSAQNTGGATGLDTLAVQLSELARSLQQDSDPHETLVKIVDQAVALIPGCDAGSISVVRARKQVTSEAASGELPRVVDKLQEEVGQGPCLDAAYQEETVRVADMASETRWPLFAARALAAGAGGILCFQLYVEDDNLGALNLYSYEAHSFDDESEHVGLLFASHAAVAYAAVRQQANLSRSLATRQLIGQAQGILMERHGITGDQAFAVLTRASQNCNIKLRDVAEHLVLSGLLDTNTPGTVPPAA
jgi:GAF domain-containing protein